MRIPRSCCRAGVQKATEFATVVTDLTTCHNTWFHPRVDQCFVATQEARRRAMRMGLKVGLADCAGCSEQGASRHGGPQGGVLASGSSLTASGSSSSAC